MGFIKAFSGAMGATFADQWLDFYEPMKGVPATAGLFRAVPKGTNAGVGENYKGQNNVSTNGSKIIVPEGTALITMQDGQITGLIAEPGGFEFKSDDPNSRSMFAGDGILDFINLSTFSSSSSDCFKILNFISSSISFFKIVVLFCLTKSIIFKAITTGTSISKSCVVKYKFLSKFVASTTLIMQSGFSSTI